ncbi:MAG: GNAT family N-acetyltransferase [Alphaproteobacteria bacterium]|nr:GNAT family N-acetyltransferase [Rhodospirillales bacterium]MCW9045728.1 GNAT family N-acetyltransferase [Alphaproteobacteria bacterium]
MKNYEFEFTRHGSPADVIKLHQDYYEKEWGFGEKFETKVTTELLSFLDRLVVKRDLFLCAYVDANLQGSITIDGIDALNKGAHLRWFIVAPESQGSGLGTQLLNEAIKFCREKKYPKIYLHTFAELGAAAHLYQKIGFKLEEERYDDQWSAGVTEQHLVLNFSNPASAIK